MKSGIRLWTALLLAAGCTAGANEAGPLTLTNLLQSVDAHYPSVIAAVQELEAAKAQAQSAAGAFDLKIRFNSRNDPLGYYENRILEALLEQPLRFRGTKLYGGWKRGDGLFPFQEEKRETQSAGEVIFGVSTPLLRGAEIDQPRAELRRTALAIDYQEAAFTQLRLLAQQAAVEQFWRWGTAARRQAIYDNLLRLALTRDAGLRQQIAIGEKAEVDATDNARLIAKRRESLVAAEQKFQAEAVKLSLYWRDLTGSPLIPEAPPEQDLISTSFLLTDIDLTQALAAHPEVTALQRVLATERVSQELYRNQMLPQLDLSLSASKDLGIGSKTKENPEFRIGAAFEFPFQNRKARGAMEAASSKLAALEQKLTLLFDQLRARVQIADRNIKHIRERIQRLQERLDLTIRMRQAETERVELKLSDLLRLNLREQDVAAAEIDLLDARLELRLAELERINALAVDLLSPAADAKP